MCWLLCLMVGGGSALQETAERFFAVYAARSDFEALMGLYAQDAVLEDIVFGDRKEGREAIRDFLNWGDPKYALGPSGRCLAVERLVVSGQVVVAKGYFMPFTYDGKAMGPWQFVIWLEFNDDMRIKRHVDLINYPNELISARRDSNQWIQLDEEAQ